MVRKSVFCCAIFFLASGCLGPLKELYPEDEALRPVTVYVLSHGWHVGIAVESRYIADSLPAHRQMPQARYLKFGWGDRRYYPHEDPGFGMLLAAALLPTRSTIHVVGIDIELEHYFPGSDIIRVQVSEEGVEKVARFIADRFRKTGEGEARFTADGLYRNSAFFDATGFYFVPKTSNTWTAKTLRRTGAPITPVYAVTSGNVIQQARSFGEVVQLRE